MLTLHGSKATPANTAEQHAAPGHDSLTNMTSGSETCGAMWLSASDLANLNPDHSALQIILIKLEKASSTIVQTERCLLSTVSCPAKISAGGSRVFGGADN